eukprot:CAMPEP_0172593488 /NCGR_PEP_ID=MMETSP1068-20121228/12686_1 /TAXON_ID=35684 /ORGANISM="Pseudopedinella elastica, Strain CCMP716" /LENGTH=245 /DNA_ID=CAMNT_0013391029 /DNA_START=37 /DNA_END=774 /DNA_ORIENTATION=-
MMRAAALALCLGASSAFQAAKPVSTRSAVKVQESKADLQALAGKCNPIVKFFDPLDLAGADFWGKGEAATIGFLRESEIKHGRIAMFAFCGFIAGSNGVTFPWPIDMEGHPFPSAGGVPGAQWDALSMEAKAQIIGFIALMEIWNEGVGTHYMKGGKPGDFPSFKDSAVELPHPVPFDLFDPFGLSKSASAEKKAAGLVKEINNGRLAQIGIFGFLAESKLDGSVPALTGLIKHYDGDYMAPFSG